MPRDESLTAPARVGPAATTLSYGPRDDLTLERARGEELLTAQDAARFLNVSVSWVYERTRSSAADRLPVVKLGKYVRFSRDDLRAYVEAKREASRATRRAR
jgi:excisionase family DNA binding protein